MEALREGYEIERHAMESRHRAERQELEDRHWKRARLQAPPGTTREAWLRPAKRTKRSHVRLHSLPGNQFTTPGGRTACTAIAFIALCRMSTKATPEAIRTGIKWRDVLAKGADLWRSVMGEDRSLDGQRYLSLYDMQKLPRVRNFRCLHRVLEKATEVMGSMDPEVNASFNDADNKAMYDLSEALATMHSMQPSVAVLTVGDVSVCAWHRDDQWILYDSHRGPTQGTSLLAVVTEASDPADFEAILRARFRHAAGQRKLDVPIGGRTTTTYYSASVLSAEAVSSCKNGK